MLIFPVGCSQEQITVPALMEPDPALNLAHKLAIMFIHYHVTISMVKNSEWCLSHQRSSRSNPKSRILWIVRAV